MRRSQKKSKVFSGILLFHLILEYLLFTLSLISVSLLWKEPFTLVFILIIISVFMLVKDFSVVNILYYISVATGGAVAEIVAVFFGAWKYSLSNFLGIPIWLSLLWGIAGLFFKRIAIDLQIITQKQFL